VIIDAHAQVWDPAWVRYPWLRPRMGPLTGAFTYPDLAAHLDDEQEDDGCTADDPVRAVLVQACDDPRDVEVMASVARDEARVAGLVVWAPLDRPDEVADEVQRARGMATAAGTRVVGVRTLQHHRRDPGWVLRPETDAGLGVLERLDLPYDYVTSDGTTVRRAPARSAVDGTPLQGTPLQGTPSNGTTLGGSGGILVTGSIAVDPAAGVAALAVLPAVGERHPGLRLVLDHLGGPVLGDRAGLARWRAALAEVARNPLVVAKLSGLYATDGPGPSYADDVREVVDVALDLFGPQRLMLGSDWPVCLLADPGRRARAAVDAALERALDGDDLAAVRSGTAARTYGLALVSR